MSEVTVTTYVRYLYPGAFFPEESAKPIGERDPQRIAAEAPEGVFAFTFYDVATTTTVINGQDVTLRSSGLNTSKRHYIDAEELTAYQVGQLPGDHHILLENMRSNHWDIMLRCRTGNFQPLEDGDVLVSSRP